MTSLVQWPCIRLRVDLRFELIHVTNPICDQSDHWNGDVMPV